MNVKRLNLLFNVYKDNERKSITKMTYEMFICLISRKEIPYHYFTHLLYKKGTDNIVDYVGNKDIKKIVHNFFKPNGKANPYLENKLLFQNYLDDKEIPLPKMIGHSNNSKFNVNNDTVFVKQASDLEKVLESHLNENGNVFIKPVGSEGGKGSFKIETLADIQEIFQDVIKNDVIIQETLVQHKDVNCLYPNSINTLRIHTFKENNKVQILSALMRFGSSGSVVDNGSSGGLYVPVDIFEGKLIGKGKNYFKNGGLLYNEHPDTGIKFDGFKIPMFDETVSLCKEVAALFSNKVIGWDVALTDHGPVVIEGNSNPHLIMAQVSCGGFLSHEGFKYAFKEYIRN